jgi:protocatechuate 3,4-dioxygenase alpha subunit
MTATRSRLIATPSQTVGPFFGFGLTTKAELGVVAQPDAPGEPIHFGVRLVDGHDAPVPDAVVELWQADARGNYGSGSPHFRGFGRLPTDRDGRCTFRTVRPGVVTDARGGRHAAHINLCLFMRGLLRHIYTRAYFAGDPELPSDPVLLLVPEERRATLITHPVAEAGSRWHFDIRLQGEDATVFFDV